MGRWTVGYEMWIFVAGTGQISSIGHYSKFTIEAVSFKEAVEVAEKKAPGELRKMQEEFSSEFSPSFHYRACVLDLKDEKGAYYKLRNSHGVFGGQIRELDQFGE